MMAWPTAALADADCAFPTACFEDEPCEESRLELSLKTLRLEGASSDITILTRRDEAFGLQPIAEGDAAVRTLGGVTASGFHLLTISTEDHDRYTTHFFDGPTSLTYLGIYEAS